MEGQTALNFAAMFTGICIAAGKFFPRLNNIDGVTVDEHYCIGTWDKDAKNANGMSTKDRVTEIYSFQNGEWREENHKALGLLC